MADKSNLVLHNAYSRFLYAFTLMFLPIDAVKKLWQKIPVEINGEPCSGKKLFSYFWAGKGSISLEYISLIWLELENAFLSCGRYIREDFIEFLKKGDVIEAGMIFRFFEPVLLKIFKAADIKFAILKFIGTLHEMCNPQARWVTEDLRKTANGMIRCYHILAMDKKYLDNLPNADGDLAFVPLSQYIPLRFGATPFNKSIIIAERQSVFIRIDSKLNPAIKNDIFYIGDLKYGIVSSLYDFLKKQGLFLKKISPPNCDVVVIEKDFYCPIRKRTILYSGCAYGSSVWIMQLEYNPKENKVLDPLLPLRKELLADNQTTYQFLQPKHESLLDSFSKTIQFRFKIDDQAIYGNDRFITSGIQGKILKKMLVEYKENNRTEFERREFIKDKEFICDPESTGFNCRMNRIIKCVDKTCPEMKIEKTSRGRFKLTSSTPITITYF